MTVLGHLVLGHWLGAALVAPAAAVVLRASWRSIATRRDRRGPDPRTDKDPPHDP